MQSVLFPSIGENFLIGVLDRQDWSLPLTISRSTAGGRLLNFG